MNFQVFNYDEFKLHLIDGYIQKTPILEYHDKILIMDGGTRADSEVIIEYINRHMKRSVKDVKLMIASHCHPDHSGAVSFFRRNFNIPIAAPGNINKWYSGLLGFIQHKVDISLAHFVAASLRRKFRFLVYSRKIRFDIPLVDGDKLPFFEDWVVYSAKGHTGHDIVLYNEEKRIVYVGDVILKIKKGFALPMPISFIDLMEESIKFLKDLNPESLFLAHGGHVSGEEFQNNFHVLMDAVNKFKNGKGPGTFFFKVTGINTSSKNNYKKLRQ